MKNVLNTLDGLNLDIPEDRKKSNLLLVEYFFKLIEQFKPAYSFELGAFSAEFSRRIKKTYPEVVSYAFEANPHNYDFFLNKGGLEDLHYINKALSNVNDKITFNIQKSINQRILNPVAGNNSILEKVHASIKYDKIEVDAITLDSFVNLNGLSDKTNVLWIDVEGAADKVLNGCIETLKNTDLIFIEVETFKFWKDQWLQEDVYNFLNNAGFSLIARDSEYVNQYNQIYIKKNYEQFVTS